MRYKIEYLALTGVVHQKMPYALSLDGVAKEARTGGAAAKFLFGANSFQVLDMNDEGKVVVSEQFVP